MMEEVKCVYRKCSVSNCDYCWFTVINRIKKVHAVTTQNQLGAWSGWDGNQEEVRKSKEERGAVIDGELSDCWVKSRGRTL